MRKQINMLQQEKTPENKLNEMEASSLSEAGFKIMIIRMLIELSGRMEEHNENLTRDSKCNKEHRSHKKEPDRNKEYNN